MGNPTAQERLRRQPYPVTQLTGGLDVSLDALFLADQTSPDLLNVWFDKGRAKKDFGWHELGGAHAAFDGTPMALYILEQTDEDSYLVCITTRYLYYYDSGTSSWVKVTGSLPLTGGVDNFVSCTTYLDTLVFTNGVDPIKKWEGPGNNVENLVCPYVTCRSVGTFYNSLLLFNVTEEEGHWSWRVRWSAPGDMEDWVTSPAGYIDVLDTPDPGVAIAKIGMRAFLYKTDSIWEIFWLGYYTYFSVSGKVIGTGTRAPKTIQNIWDTHLFISMEAVKQFDVNNATPISAPIYPQLFQLGEAVPAPSDMARSCGLFVYNLNEYWFCVPSAAGGNPAVLYKYNLVTKSWTKKPCTANTMIIYKTFGSRLPWSALVGTWAALGTTYPPGTWADLKSTGTGEESILLGCTDGKVYADTRTDTDSTQMTYVTKDFVWSHAARVCEFRVQAKGGPFDVSYSTDSGATWSAAITLPLSTAYSEYIVPLNLTTQRIRFKIETVEPTLEIEWIEPWYIPRYRSKYLTR